MIEVALVLAVVVYFTVQVTIMFVLTIGWMIRVTWAIAILPFRIAKYLLNVGR